MLLSDAEKVMLGGKRVTSVLHGDRRLLGFTNLVPNPSFEATDGAVEVRRNLASYPRGSSSKDPTILGPRSSRWFGYAPDGGTWGRYVQVTNATDGPFLGRVDGYLRKEWVASFPQGTGDLGFDFVSDTSHSDSYSGGPLVTPGTSIYISGAIRSNFSGNTTFSCKVLWRTSAGTLISRSVIIGPNLVGGEWVYFQFAPTPPSGSSSMTAVLDIDGRAPEAGDTLDIVAGLFTSPGAYFDGSYSPDSDLIPSWIGAPNASESILTATRPAGYAAGWQSGQWAAHGTKSLRVPPGAGETISPAGRVMLITPRVAGQTYTADGQTRTTGSTPLRIADATTVTLGEGWWDQIALIDGTAYKGSWFTSWRWSDR